MQWYFGGFRNTVGNTWELRWVGGGSIGNWADPNYVGWTDDSNQVDGCASNSSSPDRALLNITDDFHSDISYWVTQTTAAMNNLRRKYPSVGAIILQPVVGGPGGNQCTFNGSVVRASYNFPYINQAINQMANGSTVLKGMAPTVRTCADYADNIGHLTDQAKGPIGVAIGDFYNSFTGGGGGGGGSAPTNTPTPGATSTPTRTPTAIPTVGAGQTRTITFDDLTNPGRPFSGQYPAGVIDWGTNSWYLSGPYGAFRTNSFGFNGSGPTSASFSYVSPMRLLSIDAYNGGSSSSTVTLRCNGTLASTVTVQPGQVLTLSMSAAGACTTVTVGSSNGWNTNFDNLVIDSGVPPTSTPTATPTNAPSQPTSTPTAVSASSFTLTFDDTWGQNRVLSGQYPSGVIDWGTNDWYLSGPYGAFNTKSVGFNGTGRTAQSFTLLRPLRLVRLDAYNGGSTTTAVSITCAGQPTVQVGLNPRQLLSIATGWTGTCTSIGISSSNGWDTNFDNMLFDNGPSGGGSSAINFDDLSNPNRTLNGQYPSGVVDWGTSQWYLSGPYGAFRTNSIGFNGSGPTSAGITFVTARRLTQIDAYNGGSASSIVTLSCAGQPAVSVTIASRATVTIATGWTGTCTTVTVGSTNGWDTNFDNLMLQ